MAYIGKTRDYLLDLNAGEEVFRKAHELKHPMTDSEVKEHDENRTAELDRLGINVIRFTNDQIFHQLEHVLEEIVLFVKTLDQPSPPFSLRRRGRGLRWFVMRTGAGG